MVSITPSFLATAPESALVSFGRTKVVCAATLEVRVEADPIRR